MKNFEKATDRARPSRRDFIRYMFVAAAVGVLADKSNARCLPSLGNCDRRVRRRAKQIDNIVGGRKARVSRGECNRLSRQMDYEAPQYRNAVLRCRAEYGSYANMSEHCKKVCAQAFRKNRFFGRMWWQCYRAGFAPKPSGVYANPKNLSKWGLKKFIKYLR